MTFGKMLLWGGAGYLGYKLLTKDTSTYMPGDVAAQNLFIKAGLVLDPNKMWTITVAKNTGAVNIKTDDGTTNQVFVNAQAAQAWLNTIPPHGGVTAAVTYVVA